MPTPASGPSHIQSADAAPSLIVATGGSATAGGTTTGATGSVNVSAHAAGHASVAVGDASFQAEAGATGSAPTADATTFLNVSGANVIVVRESSGSAQGSTDASAGSTLHFVAIANGSSNPHGPVVIDVRQPFHSHGDTSPVDASGGNYAHVSASADTHGIATTAATVSDATTVENQFSLVHATSLVAV